MATSNENTVTINKSVEQVHAAFSNADYWTYIAENLFPEAGELNNFDGSTATLYEVLPLEFLPEAVHAMVKDALKVKRVVKVGDLTGDSFTFDYNADVKGTPAVYRGNVKVNGSGETTTLAYDNEVEVDIPFMGEAIEGKVVEYLENLFTKEGELTEEWISNNA